jgi:hypothetical protein
LVALGWRQIAYFYILNLGARRSSRDWFALVMLSAPMWHIFARCGLAIRPEPGRHCAGGLQVACGGSTVEAELELLLFAGDGDQPIGVDVHIGGGELSQLCRDGLLDPQTGGE